MFDYIQSVLYILLPSMSRLGSLLKVNLGRNKLDFIPDRWAHYSSSFEKFYDFSFEVLIQFMLHQLPINSDERFYSIKDNVNSHLLAYFLLIYTFGKGL
mgnify:FL=1